MDCVFAQCDVWDNSRLSCALLSTKRGIFSSVEHTAVLTEPLPAVQQPEGSQKIPLLHLPVRRREEKGNATV
jgi:hypothetical protein